VAYAVSTPVFEGPIDLLLHLVSSHEVDVLEVPLLPVVDAFVSVLSEQRDAIGVNQLSEFLLVASILIELKSQRLLPGPESTEDDEDYAGWEERDLLLARLLECRAYAAAADVFVAMAEHASRSIPREVGLDDGFAVHAPDLLAGVTAEDLAQAYLRGSAERQVPRVDLSHVTVDTVSVSEAVADLIATPTSGRAGTFRELVAACRTRIEVIVRFLALLELCKMGRVSLGQGSTFGELRIVWAPADELAGVHSGRGLAELDGYEIDDYDG
jgi:segregation and condensation protein A